MPALAPRDARKTPTQRIIGVDPGTLVTGWGAIEARGSNVTHLGHGTIATARADSQADRLSLIYRGLEEAIRSFQPEGLSLERVFFRATLRARSSSARRAGSHFWRRRTAVCRTQYAASEIKLAVVGYGYASKAQVQVMVTSLLRIREKMAPDAADALAAAICHVHRQSFKALVARAVLSGSQRYAGADFFCRI